MPPVNISIDFSALAGLIANAIFVGIQHILSPVPQQFEEWLFNSLQGLLASDNAMNLLTHVPVEWTAKNADVLLLWRNGIFIESALGAIVIAIGGYRVMAGKDDIWHVVFRYGFLVIAGEAMAFWSLLIINFVNAASDAVGKAPMDIRQEIMPNDVVLSLMLIIGLLLAGLTWIKGAVGVVFIDVLIVSAPYLLTLSAIPLLEGLAKWWVEEFTTWLLRPFMVALVLRLGLGLGLVNQGGIQFLFAIVSFWLAYTMDTRIRRFSVGAWGSLNTLGLFARGARFAASTFPGGAHASGSAASGPAHSAPAPAGATP